MGKGRSSAASGGRLAPATSLNAVKVYNLSSVGKALPAWLSAGRRKALVQKRDENERLEVIQELWFPTACGRVKFSADGDSFIATGCYPPQVRVYELRELSLKFSHHFVADVVQFQVLGEDWKKQAYLLADRTIELHSQFGKHHTCRTPASLERGPTRPA